MAEPLNIEAPAYADFDSLNTVRLYLERLIDRAVPSLSLYCDAESGGFVHLLKPDNEPGHFSKASTATCVSFLVESKRWDTIGAPWNAQAQELAKRIVASDWESADLGTGNSFTAAFLLEALAELRDLGVTFTKTAMKTIDKHLVLLSGILAKGCGVAIDDYPPTTFLTHKTARVLQKWERLTPELAEMTAAWSWQRLYEESVILEANGSDSDPFELIYATLTASLCTAFSDMSPRQRDALEYSVAQFFEQQNDRGTWPRSQPLFTYPKLGNAYCYDYELLTQLLQARQLHSMLHPQLERLCQAARALDGSKIPLVTDDDPMSEPTAIGWSTGHLKQEVTKPESWSTASAFHYCFLLRQLVVEAIRRHLFAYVRAPYTPPSRPRLDNVSKASFLDSTIDRGGSAGKESLSDVLQRHFLMPIRQHQENVRTGQSLPKTTPTSAILYGPPGTSKTQLAGIVSDFLGWPLLTLDPSHLTRNGIDQLHAEANKLFTMLEASEELVVLLDEFDELVRDRDESGSESASRFLTTAMLPKLAALSSSRRVVYLLATNHLERFDSAISRPGRFDMIVPVMPPTLDAKLAHWPDVKSKVEAFGLTEGNEDNDELRHRMALLTYLEFQQIASALGSAGNVGRFKAVVGRAWDSATMELVPHVSDQDVKALAWPERMAAERQKIRIPAVT